MAPRRFRRRWLWLLLPLVALIGFFVLRALLQPERVSAFLLRQAEAATGLSLSLEQPADIGIWPDLHLELIGLTASAPGAAAPLLRAERVEAALPWSALRAETLQLQRLTLVQPRLDLAALQAWLAADDTTGPPAPLRLPQFDAAFAVEDGSVIGDGWELQQLAIALPALRSGEATVLDASGAYVSDTATHGFDLRLSTTPTFGEFDIALVPLSLDIGGTPLQQTRLQLGGELHFSVPDALRFGLATDLATWPAHWPALPLRETSPAVPTSLRIDFSGTTALQGDVDLRVVRGEDSIEGTLAIGDVFAWLGAPDTGPLPPLRGQIAAPRLQIDGIEASGVTLRFSDDETAPAQTDATR
ncbi:AsmA family protein [Chiayiivirga flava]|uniref:AsmA family protein n=1 Tax=Chiayiivirga flava TaxID=659595 RepID=A0A7W8D3D1_9GAMM|nr:AsmA family protein [Chiayiivirga flava]MBB5207169.1 hypothetical protein [Chiayiivirga flava]